MKKILSAVAAFALAAALISCGGNSDEFDGKVDTVLTIGAPSVKAHAYPGVNYVTWDPIASAKSYEIYRIGDGEATGTRLNDTAKCEFADVASTSNIIADGKTYKYVVIAVPENAANSGVATPAQIPTRAIYMKANQGSASVKAVVPAAGSKITEFTDSYTKNFLKKYASTDAAALKKQGVEVKLVNLLDKGADLFATYPATAGFRFGVKFLNKTQPDTINSSKLPKKTDGSLDLGGVYLENYTANATTPALGAGEYDAYLTIASVSDLYPVTETYSLGTYTVKALSESNETSIVTKKYTADGSAINIAWTPAKFASGKIAATSNYKVYRATAASIDDGVAVEDVTGTIAVLTDVTTLTDAKDVYQITDKITDKTVPYSYVVVLFDKDADGNIEFGKAKKAENVTYTQVKTADVTTFSASKISKDKDNLKNSIKVTVKETAPGSTYAIGSANYTVNARQTLKLEHIVIDSTVISGNDWTKTFDKTTTWTPDKLENEDKPDYTWFAYVDGAKNGTYLFKLTVSEAGKADNIQYTTAQVGLTRTDCVVTGITMRQGGADATEGTYAVVDANESGDTVGLYKYKFVTVTTTFSRTTEYENYVKVETKEDDLSISYKKVEASGDEVKKGGLIANNEYCVAMVSDKKAADKSTKTKITKEYYVKKYLKDDETQCAYTSVLAQNANLNAD